MSTKLRSLIALIGVVLLSLGVSLGPIGTATATGGNNGTIKIHEQGTPPGSESNDPKVCSFNIEGYGFDAGQTGYIVFDVQGGDGPTGTPAGPFNFGPADSGGYYATQYFSLDDGHYKATLYGKFGNGDINYQDVKASSKVFKVECAPPPTTPEGSNNSSSPSCEKITVGMPTGVKPVGASIVIKLDGVSTMPGTYDATPGSHVVTTYVNGVEVDKDTVTVEACPPPPVEPEGAVLAVSNDCETITFSSKDVKPEDATVVLKLDGVTKSAGTYDVTPGQHTVELFVNGNKVDSKTVTVEECELPPPPDTCPVLTGSVKTTLPDGSVVNGNIYTNKSDVYISGSQLGDVTTVYIRVTDPSGSTVLSDVKQVSVVGGSFGPVQLPSFADTPNNGDEYKVWVSSTPDFESKCTKFDNFKVRGEEPPPPAGMSTFSVDCESLEITAPTGVEPEDAEYQYYLDGEPIGIGSHELAPGDYTLTLEVNDTEVDSDDFTVEECDEPPSYVVTVIPNQGNCEVRTPEAKVTTSFASSIGYRLVGAETKFVYTEVPAGTYTLTLPGVNPGGSVSYEVVVVPLDDSAEPIVKGPFDFSVPKNCDEVPPCTEFQDEDAGQPCYVEREPDVRTKSSERSNCKLGGTETTTAVYTTTWEFNEVTQQWESSKTATSSVSFEPFTAEQLAACDKNPDNPDTPPTDNPPTFVPPSTGGGDWPTDFGPAQDNSLGSLLSKLMVLMGGALFLVSVFAPRRRKLSI